MKIDKIFLIVLILSLINMVFAYECKDAKIVFQSIFKDGEWETFIDEIGVVQFNDDTYIASGNPLSEDKGCRAFNQISVWASIHEDNVGSMSWNYLGNNKVTLGHIREPLGEDFIYSNPSSGVHIWRCFHSFLSIDFNIDTKELSKAHIYKMKACTQGCHHEECPNRIDKYDENHWLYNYYREPNPLFLFGK